MKASGESASEENQQGRLSEAILDFIGRLPSTFEVVSEHPEARAHKISISAARRAAATAGTLALPPGPLGFLTIVPEILAVWQIQAQMVADIAGIYGKNAQVTREQMIYCLFRHSAAQLLRDVVVRVGERYLVRRVSLRALKNIAGKIGVRISQRVAGRAISRWLPVAGAIGVGGYAYFDCRQVARTAVELFSNEIDIEVESLEAPGGGAGLLG